MTHVDHGWRHAPKALGGTDPTPVEAAAASLPWAGYHINSRTISGASGALAEIFFDDDVTAPLGFVTPFPDTFGLSTDERISIKEPGVYVVSLGAQGVAMGVTGELVAGLGLNARFVISEAWHRSQNMTPGATFYHAYQASMNLNEAVLDVFQTPTFPFEPPLLLSWTSDGSFSLDARLFIVRQSENTYPFRMYDTVV